MTYRIAEVADLVGVPTTTLRYYEDVGLVPPPARGSNGYRTYDDDDVARLRFVAGAKNLGLPLADVAALAAAYDADDCATVAHHVLEMVAERLAETQRRIAELVALAAQLQAVEGRLAKAPAGRACGADCACATAGAATAGSAAGGTTSALVPLTRAPNRGSDAVPLAARQTTDGVVVAEVGTTG